MNNQNHCQISVPLLTLPQNCIKLLTYCGTNPFAYANAENSGAGAKEYIHVHVQQRNGRKSLTTVQGLKKEFCYNNILKDLKKDFCCNGTVVHDPELGQVTRTLICSLVVNLNIDIAHCPKFVNSEMCNIHL